MPDFYFPTGTALINFALCGLIIGVSIFILKKLHPKTKYVLYGTIGFTASIMWHIITVPSMYDTTFSSSGQLVSILIIVSALLGGYYFEASDNIGG